MPGAQEAGLFLGLAHSLCPRASAIPPGGAGSLEKPERGLQISMAGPASKQHRPPASNVVRAIPVTRGLPDIADKMLSNVIFRIYLHYILFVVFLKLEFI